MPTVGNVLPPWATPPTTSAIAGMFLVLRTQDLDRAEFHCPSVQPTTREGIESWTVDDNVTWPDITPGAGGFPTRQAGY